MKISEVRFKLVDARHEGGNRLRAFCTITLDDEFVVRDLRIIEGPGAYFVAMPSRKLRDRCARCGAKNHLRAKFCNECGTRLNENRAPRDHDGRVKLHSDIAHPLNAGCREWMEKQILEAFEVELRGIHTLERQASPVHQASAAESDRDLDDQEVAEPTPQDPPPSGDREGASDFGEGIL